MTNEYITSALLEEEPDYIDLIDKFISRLPGMRNAIFEAYENKEWETFLALVHQMKGVGGGYGYPMLTQLCEDIEMTHHEKNFAQLKIQITSLREMCEKILAGDEENHKISAGNG